MSVVSVPFSSTAISNCPSIYVAAHEIADGYPDPKTGKCSALSSAFNFTAVAAFIIHPDVRQTAANSPGPIDRLVNFFKGLL
jgi:hypothetical protein